MAIYSIGQLKANLVSKGYGDYWEDASDGDAVCMYVRLLQKRKKGNWDTINVEDTAKYFGVSTPWSCPKTAREVNQDVREKSESFFKGIFGEVLVSPKPNELVMLNGSNDMHNDFSLSFLLLGIAAYKVFKK